MMMSNNQQSARLETHLTENITSASLLQCGARSSSSLNSTWRLSLRRLEPTCSKRFKWSVKTAGGA